MERHHIDSELTVGQLLRRNPSVAAVFVRRGMACPGCAMAPFETLAEVATVYGQDLPGFLADLAGAPSAGMKSGSSLGTATARPRETRSRRR